MKNLIGGIFVLLSAVLQQRNLQKPSNFSSIISVFSLLIESFALIILPLSNYVLLCSLHLLTFSLYQSHSSNLPLPSPQYNGNILIILGCILSTIFSSEQGEISDYSQISIVFNPLFYTWLLFSLFCTLFLRKNGCYVSKALIESNIPAQIFTFSAISLKILWIELEFMYRDKMVRQEALILSNFVWAFGMLCTSSFVKYLCVIYNPSLVRVGYYFWMLINCFPIGISVVRAGVEFNLKHLYSITGALLLIGYGTYLHTKLPKVEKLDDEEITKLI